MLNPRLLACADFVRSDAYVCDVGTDHAQLPVYLLETGRAVRAIAADISEGPLQAARRTIVRHGMTDNIKTILSDGLLRVPDDGLTDIIIAGMGGETMIHILESCPFALTEKRLILQPMTKVRELRMWLYQNGFAIQEETCARDGRFLYAVMCVTYTGERQKIGAAEQYIGKMNLHEPDCRAYALRQYKQVCTARDGRQRAGQDAVLFAAAAEELWQKLEDK